MNRLTLVALIIFAFALNAFSLVPDSSFGFNGKIDAGFGLGNDIAFKTAQAPDGSVIQLARAGSGLSNFFVLQKLTPQGAPDETFGQGGIVAINSSPLTVVPFSSEPVDLAVGPDGSIYVAGGHGFDMSVGKYSANGDLVQVFDGGQTAFLTNGVAQAITLQPDGSILVAGYQGNEFHDLTIYKYLPSGSLDNTFGNGGRSYTHVGWKSKPTSIYRNSEARLLVTGWVIPENSPTPNQTQSMVARFNSDGTPDSSFNNSGIFISPVRGNRSEKFEKAVTLKDGRVMLVGTNLPVDLNNNLNYIFVRLMPNGMYDRLFGSRGTIISGFSTFDYQYTFAYKNDGTLFLANRSSIYRFDVDGNLDPSYGTQGVATLDPNFSASSLTAAGDKLIVGGAFNKGFPIFQTSNFDYDLLAARLNANGSPDNTFDGDGAATRDVGNFAAAINAMALQPDGKVVIGGGYASDFSATSGTGLARYNTDGTKDSAFGSLESFFSQEARTPRMVLGVAVQPDGKIVVAEQNGTTGPNNSTGIRVLRFNENGTLDHTFAVGGIFTYQIQGTNIFAIKLQADGKILLGGYDQSNFLLMRLTTDGAFDASLGGSGIVTTDISGWDGAMDMVLQPDGKVVLAGCSGLTNVDLSMARYNTDGSLDQNFGRRGKVLVSVPGYFESCIRALAASPDGSLFVSGYSRSASNTKLVAAKFSANGALDAGFANGGLYLTAPAYGSYLSGQSAMAMANGNFLVAAGVNGDLQILRLSANGTPDTAWGPNGLRDTGISDGNFFGPEMLMDPQGRLVIAGTGNAGSGYIVRFTVDN